MLRRLYLMDGSGYIFRAFFALPRLSTRDGLPTNALYGFTTMLLKLLRQQPQGLVVAFESPTPGFRRELASSYKAQRPPVPDELRLQLPLCREMVEALGVRTLAADGFEADDVIATLVDRALDWEMEPVILSSDKDLMQLVGARVKMIDPIHDRPYGPDEVRDKLGVGPERVVDLLALAGDTSDNVPGVAGIGLKTAAKLLEEFGDLDTLLQRAGEIKGKRGETLRASREVALLSRTLVRLRHDVPLQLTPDDVRPQAPDLPVLRDKFTRWEFHGLLRTLEAAAEATSSAAGPVAVTLPMTGQTPLPFDAPDDPEAESGATPAAETPSSPAPSAAIVATLTAEPATVRVLRSPRELQEALTSVRQAGRLALRTIAARPGHGELVGLALAWSETEAIYLPLGHRDDPDGAQLDATETLALLGPLLEQTDFPKYSHDSKRDHLSLARHGLDLRGVVGDSLLASYLLDPETRSHDLESLAAHHLQLRLSSTGALLEQAGNGRSAALDPGSPAFAERLGLVPSGRLGEQAGRAVAATLALEARLAPRLEAAGMGQLYRGLEVPLARVLAKIEARGIALDPAQLVAMSGRFEEKLQLLERECHELAGRAFLISSPKQLAEVLFDELKLRQTKKTKTARSTDQSVLEELSLDHPLPAKVLEYRQVAKLKNTYIDTLPKMIDARTGRLHTCLNQAVAATGRLSSTDPNLQNIPIRNEEGRRIRAAFVAAPGCLLLSADYSQIELRVLAHLAEEPALVEAFRRGEDIHAATAAQLFGGLLPGLVTPDQRRAAKVINFGILYGMSAFRLAREQGIPRQQAQRFIDAYFERYGRIRLWIEENLVRARELGYTTTLLGRRRPIPGLHDRNHNTRSAAERVATNSPIQGSAADIIKLAMLRLQDQEDRGELPTRLVLQVHDELLLEVEEEAADAAVDHVRQAMMEATQLRVPLEVEVGRGRSWAEAH